MENMPQNIRPKDLSFVVQAIGARYRTNSKYGLSLQLMLICC